MFVNCGTRKLELWELIFSGIVVGTFHIFYSYFWFQNQPLTYNTSLSVSPYSCIDTGAISSHFRSGGKHKWAYGHGWKCQFVLAKQVSK